MCVKALLHYASGLRFGEIQETRAKREPPTFQNARPSLVSYITTRVFGCIFGRVESKMRPDTNQDGGRGDIEAHRRIPFSSARMIFRRRAGRGASQTEEKKNLGTGVVETSARCRYRHHVHAPA